MKFLRYLRLKWKSELMNEQRYMHMIWYCLTVDWGGYDQDSIFRKENTRV